MGVTLCSASARAWLRAFSASRIVFQLGLSDLGVGILLRLLRSTAPLRSIQRSLVLSVAFVENQNAKRHKFTDESILEHSTFPFLARLFRPKYPPRTEIGQAGPLSNSKKML